MTRWQWLLVVIIAAGLWPMGSSMARGQDQFINLARVPEIPDAGMAPILERELMRQALLMAARDDLGYFTRDAVLDEDAPENGNAGRQVALSVAADKGARSLNLSFLAGAPAPASVRVTVPRLASKEYPDAVIPDLAE